MAAAVAEDVAVKMQYLAHKNPKSETEIEPGVKMIAIINKQGRLEDYFGSDSIDMSKERREMYFMKIALRNSMQKDFDESHILGLISRLPTIYRPRNLLQFSKAKSVAWGKEVRKLLKIQKIATHREVNRIVHS